jgi:hypothetical protein
LSGIGISDGFDLRLKAKGKQAVLDPTPDLPDDTLIEDVRFATRIRNALNAAGLKTVGEVRETSDEILLSFQDLGQGSVAHPRDAWPAVMRWRGAKQQTATLAF